MSQDIIQHELIGLEIEIRNAKNKALNKIKGKIIDETKNTIKVQTKNTKKILLKNQITIKTKWKNKIIKINGKFLMGRPEERLKH